MAFVPGFDHDALISYAHGDDRDWINRFLDPLEPAPSRPLPGAMSGLIETTFANPAILSGISRQT
jgi:hypothetical protein